jgi:hypothetical protein
MHQLTPVGRLGGMRHRWKCLFGDSRRNHRRSRRRCSCTCPGQGRRRRLGWSPCCTSRTRAARTDCEAASDSSARVVRCAALLGWPDPAVSGWFRGGFGRNRHVTAVRSHPLFEVVCKMLDILLELFWPLNTDPMSFCHQNVTIHTYCSHLTSRPLWAILEVAWETSRRDFFTFSCVLLVCDCYSSI